MGAALSTPRGLTHTSLTQKLAIFYPRDPEHLCFVTRVAQCKLRRSGAVMLCERSAVTLCRSSAVPLCRSSAARLCGCSAVKV